MGSCCELLALVTIWCDSAELLLNHKTTKQTKVSLQSYSNMVAIKLGSLGRKVSETKPRNTLTRRRMPVKGQKFCTYSSVSMDASNSAFSLMNAFCKADICAMILARLSCAIRAFFAFSSSWETILSREGRVLHTSWGFSWCVVSSSCKVCDTNCEGQPFKCRENKRQDQNFKLS